MRAVEANLLSHGLAQEYWTDDAWTHSPRDWIHRANDKARFTLFGFSELGKQAAESNGSKCLEVVQMSMVKGDAMSDEEEIDDGGPAFPTPGKAFEFTGLAIRDWFAGQALAGFDCGDFLAEDLAGYAYSVADAMIERRKK